MKTGKNYRKSTAGNNKKIRSAEAALARFCAYQERTIKEVKEKSERIGLNNEETGVVTGWLIEEGYLNEERYATSFVQGKFRLKKWGRRKIRYELGKKGIGKILIDRALINLDDEEYRDQASHLIQKKYDETTVKNPIQRKYIVARYMISKGFESNLVWEILNNNSFKEIK